MDGMIKIGDFGLVSNTLEQCDTDASMSKSKKKLFLKHTTDVGTQLYISPEQLMYLYIRSND